MNLELNRENRCKLYLAVLESFSDCKDQNIVEAFADVLRTCSSSSHSLSEVFCITEALSDFVFENSDECGKYLQVSLEELAACIGSVQVATAALRLNGFVRYKNEDAWTNSPDGGSGFAISIRTGFFANYLRNWAKVV